MNSLNCPSYIFTLKKTSYLHIYKWILEAHESFRIQREVEEEGYPASLTRTSIKVTAKNKAQILVLLP